MFSLFLRALSTACTLVALLPHSATLFYYGGDTDDKKRQCQVFIKSIDVFAKQL